MLLNVRGEDSCQHSLLHAQRGPGNTPISAECMRHWAKVLREYHHTPTDTACTRAEGGLPKTWPEDKCGLAKWFRAQGGVINHVELAVVEGQTVDGSPAKVRGLVATRDIPAGNGMYYHYFHNIYYFITIRIRKQIELTTCGTAL